MAEDWRDGFVIEEDFVLLNEFVGLTARTKIQFRHSLGQPDQFQFRQGSSLDADEARHFLLMFRNVLADNEIKMINERCFVLYALCYAFFKRQPTTS